MPQKKRTIGDWLSNQLWNTSLPWLVGMFVIGASFYYSTTNTLAVHSQDLNTLKNLQQEQRRLESGEREKIRDAFLADSKATAAGIAELNKLTAVMGATLIIVQQQLEKIATRLETSKK